MLIDPTFATADSSDPSVAAILLLLSDGAPSKPVKLATGVYEINHHNGEYEVDTAWWTGGTWTGWTKERDRDHRYPILGNVTETAFGKFGDFGSYGVCDTYEQIIARCPELVNDTTRGFFIFVTRLRKDEQPDWGGWRWHKWGEYIGTQEPQCEYLYDEPVIEQVFTYHIYEVINDVSLKAAGVKVKA